MNDRINLTLQHEFGNGFLVDATFFMNFGSNHSENIDINLADPRIGFEHKSALNETVNNPFFGVPQQYCPGSLCNTQKVSVGSLLRPFPHFGSITQRAIAMRSERYKAFQLKVQRRFANGFNFLLGYNYNVGKNEEFYDSVDIYDRKLTYQDSQNQGQKLTLSSIYELPFGQGRKWGGGMNSAADAILGGWSISAIYVYNTGRMLYFDNEPAVITGDPFQGEQTRQSWFNQDAFERLPAFTRRENPWTIDDLRGPYFSNLDMTLNKKIPINERLDLELRMEAYNLTNSFMGADPSTNVTSGSFGQITNKLATHSGREFQYSARFIW